MRFAISDKYAKLKYKESSRAFKRRDVVWSLQKRSKRKVAARAIAAKGKGGSKGPRITYATLTITPKDDEAYEQRCGAGSKQARFPFHNVHQR